MYEAIGLSHKYVGKGVNSKEVRDLFDYYNEHCLPEVEPTRLYRMPYGAPWCAMFLCVLAHRAGYRKDKFPFEVSVSWMVKTARDRGWFRTDNPMAGDIVVYTHSHVGLVYDVKEGFIKTIEGNYSRKVAARIVDVGSPKIRGYIRVHR